VREDAISIIPDEQEAIDAALRMGRPGDLLLVFADALVRSWKQITKFRPAGSVATARAGDDAGDVAESLETGRPAASLRPAPGAGAGEGAVETSAAAPTLNLEGLIRDERGVRFAPETED
jgi:cyanophycin synthetase